MLRAGLVGNTLSMRVFSSRSMRPVSSITYLLMLAVSDSLYLVSVFLSKLVTALCCLYFPSSLGQLDLVNRSAFMCKLLQYLADLFSDYSTCLIFAFTVERCIAVYCPLRFKEVSQGALNFFCAVEFFFSTEHKLAHSEHTF